MLDVGVADALGVREVEAAHDADALGDRLVRARQLRVAGGRHQRGVELLVQARDARAVGQPAARRHQPDLLQAGERRARLAGAELLHRRAFQHHAQVVDVVERLEVERPHAPAALRVHLQVALALQAEQRLAHRRARHARAARHLVLGEAGARQQAELEDVGLDALVDRPGQVLSAFFLPRRHCRSMPRVSTTFFQRPISRSTRLRIASGVLYAGTPPKPAKRSFVSSSARIGAQLAVQPRRSAARGVPGDTARPSQELNSTPFSVSPTVGTSGSSG